jgi:hypothetical protein
MMLNFSTPLISHHSLISQSLVGRIPRRSI